MLVHNEAQQKGNIRRGIQGLQTQNGQCRPAGRQYARFPLIKHPPSPEWAPSLHITDYIAFWLRRQIPKEVRSRVRSECPRPSLSDKVAMNPELDAKVVVFISKNSKDPRKGLDKGLKSWQDWLLNLIGPLTKTFEMAEEAYLNETSVDPKELHQWAQTTLSLLGNANTALSNERRKHILHNIDLKLIALASKEGGPSRQGHLFGDYFSKDMARGF
ncbi:hypothetical protein NDU88_004731 [Pleurodeles waltl]|uniref:Uncharacterized protein n=1 Tax=Pleurodeles waltl TaxID=8319 RepID=A0AAV7TSC3_PLEWA|nr:hypothetical protein NDU88_004731 [Pleurodeles waltl]